MLLPWFLRPFPNFRFTFATVFRCGWYDDVDFFSSSADCVAATAVLGWGAGCIGCTPASCTPARVAALNTLLGPPTSTSPTPAPTVDANRGPIAVQQRACRAHRL